MNSIAYNKAFKFSINIIKTYKYLVSYKNEFVLSKQLLRAGTSIGANIKEGLQAQSRKDFLNKFNIALKEASEVEYWLELLKETQYIDKNQSELLLNDCREIIKILVSLVKTTKSGLSS